MKERPKIYTVLPDEIRAAFPHGQWILDQQGQIINFACDVDAHIPNVEDMVRRLAAFKASDDDFMEFESPHLPGRYFLHRAALEHIILTQPAWSAKVKPRQPENGRVQILDSESGLPVVRRRLD
jgi:hypothetical protein